jgi:hypothetical protein
MRNSSDKKMEATDDDTTEGMPAITTGEDATKAPSNDSTEEMPAIFTSKSGKKATKCAHFLGLTSGSFLTGLSGGLFIAGKENNTMAILTGVLGTSLLGYTSYMFWTKEKKIMEDF